MSVVIDPTIVDSKQRTRPIARVRAARRDAADLAQLADPASIPAAYRTGLARRRSGRAAMRKSLARALVQRCRSQEPARRCRAIVVLPEALTGVKAPIVVLLGRRFPMIGAHKVLAAYACLVPRLVTGRFDPARDRAVWPSTGNYCRGGVAISRILGCRGVAVLPAGMSRERFDWLRAVGRRSRRHHPHAGHREQRQGNLRQVRRARARPARTSSSISSPSSPIISSTITAPARAFDRVFARLQGAASELPAGGVRVGDRLGRDDRRRRLSQGAARHADRRRRGDRMPDHAEQRLWRAQHPGHRRQAHSADPQRDEHRRRDRRVRPRHRRAQPAVRQRCRPRLSRGPPQDRSATWSRPSTISAFPASPISSPPIKLAKHLDYGADDVIDDGRDRQRGALRQRAADVIWRGAIPTGSTR